MPISDRQRRRLKALAHHLKPVLMVGQSGLTPGVLNEFGITLETHELVKVRITGGDREQRQTMIARLCTEGEAELVQSIGHVAVFYRRHPTHPKLNLAD